MVKDSNKAYNSSTATEGRIILDRTFENKLAQSKDKLKSYYSTIKNLLLSYDGVKSRISMPCDTFRLGADIIAKITIDGKLLKLFLALNVDTYDKDVLGFTYQGNLKSYSDVPLCFVLKSVNDLENAKKLIADLMHNLKLDMVKNYNSVDFIKKYPYIENAVFSGNKNGFSDTNGDLVIDTEVDKIKYKEQAAATMQDDKEKLAVSMENMDDYEEIVEEVTVTEMVDIVWLDRTFENKLRQSDDTLKAHYDELKSLLLSYKGVKSRLSKGSDTIRANKETICKFVIVGKTIKLYLALNTDEYDVEKYNHENQGELTTYKEVPFMLRVKTDKSLKHAIELITELMKKKYLNKKGGKLKIVNFSESFPYIVGGVLKPKNRTDFIAEKTGEDNCLAEQVEYTYKKKILKLVKVDKKKEIKQETDSAEATDNVIEETATLTQDVDAIEETEDNTIEDSIASQEEIVAEDTEESVADITEDATDTQSQDTDSKDDVDNTQSQDTGTESDDTEADTNEDTGAEKEPEYIAHDERGQLILQIKKEHDRRDKEPKKEVSEEEDSEEGSDMDMYAYVKTAEAAQAVTDPIVHYYQPVVDNKGNIRFFAISQILNDKLMGMMVPQQYFDVADNSKRIEDLNKIALREAKLAIDDRYNVMGIEKPDSEETEYDEFGGFMDTLSAMTSRKTIIEDDELRLSLLMSGRNLVYRAGVDELIESIEEYKNNIILTLDYNYMVMLGSRGTFAINRMREKGIRVMLYRIEQGPWNSFADIECDYMEFDIRRYINNSSRSITLLDGMIKYCKEQGIKTVASYVDTPEIKKFAEDRQIDYMIGDEICRPMRTVGAALRVLSLKAGE